MECSNLLLYLGTIFIASDLISRISYLSNVGLLLPFVIISLFLLKKTFVRNMRQESHFTSVCLKILFLVVAPIIVIMALILLLINIALFLPGVLAIFINVLLNGLYQLEINLVGRERYIALRKKLLATMKKEKQIEEKLATPIPFLGTIGLMLVITSFVMELVG
ncbi:MAG TPA: hypothetical protein VMX96_07135 [Dehalococcoidia bacterium]|nr:hypothetical protein [Dehalococcoidia bacterium]